MSIATTQKSTELSTRPVDVQFRTIRDLLVKSKAELAMALPKTLTPERLTRISLSTLRQSPKLLECSRDSLLKCIFQCAALGLEPDPLLGYAYLVPYKGEATVIIGYKGLVMLARRSGQILSLEAHVVYEADQFEYSFGLEPKLIHVPANQEDRGPITHAWGMARFKDGGHQCDVMNLWELEAIRKRSMKPNDGPWKDHRPEMYRKTIIRRMSKMLPLTPETQRHLDAEELMEAGVMSVNAALAETDVDDDTPIDAPSTTLAERIIKNTGKPGSAKPGKDADDLIDAAVGFSDDAFEEGRE